MTLNSDQREWHENGRPSAAVGRKLPIAARHGSAQPDLESLCRTVTELAAATAKAPTRIKLQQGETTVEVEWLDPAQTASAPPPLNCTAPSSEAQDRPAADWASADQDTTHYVCAPTVGTFYHAAAPEARPFVSVGDLVRPGQPVGILEIMKMMSTIESDMAGRVVEILASDGQPVEFQQRLIAVVPESVDEPDDAVT